MGKKAKEAAEMNWFEGTPKTPEFATDKYHGTVQFLNVRNRDAARTEVYEIELRDKASHILADFRLNPEDQVRLALAILGIGRVTENVERRAQDRAALILDPHSASSVDGNLDQAVVILRAILIAREQEAKQSEAEMDAAYAFYRLAYPDAAVTRSEFPDQSMSKFWISNLRKMRKDPTVLGAL